MTGRAPRTLSPGSGDDRLRAERLRRLDEPHVAPLNALVRRCRAEGRAVPWFDPSGAGTGARVMLLLEAPGPRTLAAHPDGICTIDNDDATNRALRAAATGAGLRAGDFVKWNAVAWTPIGPDGRWTTPRQAELTRAQPVLIAVLHALPSLRAVVAVGSVALTCLMRALTLDPPPSIPGVLGVPHPSQRNTRGRAESTHRLGVALAWAAAEARRLP